MFDLFQQYNIPRKVLRVMIFALVLFLTLKVVPENNIDYSDIFKIIAVLTITFLVYELYYPTVNIELDKESYENMKKKTN